MKPILSHLLVEYIDRRLDAMLAAPAMWGTDEAVELQALQLLDLRTLAFAPENRSGKPRATLDDYAGFLRRKFPEAPTLNLAALLEREGRQHELAAILGEFRDFMLAVAVEASIVSAPPRRVRASTSHAPRRGFPHSLRVK